MRYNPKGAHKERWCHSAGCRRGFNVERDTVSYRINRVYACNAETVGEER